MPSKANRRGRPRKYDTASDAVCAYRTRMKKDGYKVVNLFLSEDAKALLDEFCIRTGVSQGEIMNYLLECAHSGGLPDFDTFRRDTGRK